MEIGFRVEAECFRTGVHTHIGSAYLTFIAIDKDYNPTEVLELIPETEEEKWCYEEAKKRRELRLQRAKPHRHR